MNQDSAQINPENEHEVRVGKLEKIKDAKIIPYASSFERTHKISEALKEKSREHNEIIESPSKKPIKICGRLKSFRSHGNLSFANIEDLSGNIQIAFMKNALGADKYKFLKNIDVADFLGITGEIFVTKKGETSILALDYEILSKTLRPLPEKFHGIQDIEKKYRQRYLDLTMNPETRGKFIFRSKFISFLRNFFEKRDFLEIETPVLAHSASGALARPFATHHNALDTDYFLRIALETPQKKLLGGGFEKVFEIGKVFRNEGMDPSHLQEFTLLEFYEAYSDVEKLKKITQELFKEFISKFGKKEIEIISSEGKEIKVNLSPPFEEITLREIIKRDSGIDYEDYKTVEELRNEIKKKKIAIEKIDKLSRGNLIDALYKKVSRPLLSDPIFITNHPIDLSPLARKNDENAEECDRFQLVIGGWEIVNAYSELIDPIDQKERFLNQQKAKKKGDEDAHEYDSEFVLAMEHGFPPCAGWGMGIDRIVALLTKSENLRDIVFFPMMK